MSCFETLQAYGLRSIGIGERLLPKADITLCEQVVLIGSGMIWNVYFGILSLAFGFWLAVALALGKNTKSAVVRVPASSFIFLFRGSPLFIQFFVAYLLFVSYCLPMPLRQSCPACVMCRRSPLMCQRKWPLSREMLSARYSLLAR